MSEAAAESISAFEAVAGTFSKPSDTFERLRKGPTWWLPFVLWMVLGVGVGAVVVNKVDWERSAQDAMEQRAAKGGRAIPDSAIPQVAKMMKTMGLVMSPVGTALFFFVVGVVLWGGAKAFGGEVRYGQMLSLWGHANLGNVAGTLLSIPVLLSMPAESLTLEGIPRAVKSNVGAFLPAETSRAVVSLAGAIDIFALATLVLTVIGFRRIPGLSKGAATAIPIALWAIFVLGRAAWMAVFS